MIFRRPFFATVSKRSSGNVGASPLRNYCGSEQRILGTYTGPFLLRRTEAKMSPLPPSVSLGSPHRSYGNHAYYLAPSLSLPSWESVRLARFFSYHLFPLSFFSAVVGVAGMSLRNWRRRRRRKRQWARVEVDFFSLCSPPSFLSHKKALVKK